MAHARVLGALSKVYNGSDVGNALTSCAQVWCVSSSSHCFIHCKAKRGLRRGTACSYAFSQAVSMHEIASRAGLRVCLSNGLEKGVDREDGRFFPPSARAPQKRKGHSRDASPDAFIARRRGRALFQALAEQDYTFWALPCAATRELEEPAIDPFRPDAAVVGDCHCGLAAIRPCAQKST